MSRIKAALLDDLLAQAADYTDYEMEIAMTELPPLGTRVRITCGGYKDDTGKVTDVYTRNGIPVIEVRTDSHIPLVYGPLQLEVIAYPVTVIPAPRLVTPVGGELVYKPLAVVARPQSVELDGDRA